MATAPQNWETGFGRIRTLLSRLLRECEKSREPVAEILDILQELETAFRAGSATPAPGKPGLPEPAHRRNKPKQYRIEQHGNVWCLAEYRAGGRQAYLCPQDFYETFAAVMANIAEPAHFPDLLQATGDRMGKQIPDYLLRTCIRFWMSTEPPIVQRTRTRYQPSRPSKFIQDARRAWRQLADAGNG